MNKQIVAVVLALILACPAVNVYAWGQDDFTPSVYYGYVMTATSDFAECTFKGYDFEYNGRLADHANAVLGGLRERYGLGMFTARVFYEVDDNDVGMQPARLLINPENPHSIGSLVYYATDKKLPAWLCVGLELYLADTAGMLALPDGFELDRDIDVSKWAAAAADSGLPGLGDEWFIPNFITSDLSRSAASAAYAFVKYLDETERLTTLIGFYSYKITDRTQRAEQLRAEAWYDMTGLETSAATFRYTYTYYLKTADFRYSSFGVTDNITFYVTAEHAEYGFVRSDFWTPETTGEHVGVYEDGFLYAKSWLEYTYTKPILVIVSTGTHQADDGINGLTDLIDTQQVIFLFKRDIAPPTTLVHEAIHALTHAFDLYGSAFYFNERRTAIEEGLCNTAAYTYAMENEYAADMMLRYLTDYPQNEGEAVHAIYKELTGREYGDGKLDMFRYADACAIRRFQTMRENIDAGLTPPDGPQVLYPDHQYMYTYETATSFLIYLTEKLSKEDMLRVYSDIDSIEEIYGKDLDGMIFEWMEFLGVSWE